MAHSLLGQQASWGVLAVNDTQWGCIVKPRRQIDREKPRSTCLAPSAGGQTIAGKTRQAIVMEDDLLGCDVDRRRQDGWNLMRFGGTVVTFVKTVELSDDDPELGNDDLGRASVLSA